jgi:hypothetical protein
MAVVAVQELVKPLQQQALAALVFQQVAVVVQTLQMLHRQPQVAQVVAV